MVFNADNPSFEGFEARDRYNYVIVISYSDFGVIDCKVVKCNVIASCAVIDSITTNYSKKNLHKYNISIQN